jgi:hypothetical protein
MPRKSPGAPPVLGTATLPDPAELARLRANLTEILGEPDLKALEANWLAKMLNGVVVTLSIGRMGCRAHLTDQDLGIADNGEIINSRTLNRHAGSQPMVPATQLS